MRFCFVCLHYFYSRELPWPTIEAAGLGNGTVNDQLGNLGMVRPYLYGDLLDPVVCLDCAAHAGSYLRGMPVIRTVFGKNRPWISSRKGMPGERSTRKSLRQKGKI